MLKSFLTITFRILWRNKVTSFVNIFSLSVGIAAFIFIMLYVHHEISYDKFNENYDRIYRLESDKWGMFPAVMGMHLKARLPEVQNVALLTGNIKNIISYHPEGQPGNLKQIEVKRIWADSTTFAVFSFPFIQGDPKTALKEPFTAVLTESTSKKLFDDVNPMGKMVDFEGSSYMITGVIHDIKKSHIEADFLMSLSSFAKSWPNANFNKDNWTWNATYLLMKSGIDEKLVENKINEALAEIKDSKLIDTEFNSFHIRPMSKLYFESKLQNFSIGLRGNKQTIMMLLAIGIFLLILAGINYVNLTTARSSIRTKEIAVKKITGSSASLLRFQLIAESIIISLISLIAALTFVQFFLPKFNQLTGVDVELFELQSLSLWVIVLAGGVLIGILAGIYPAFYLTALQPVRLIKGDGGSESSFFRSGLMTFQFTLSIIMIAAIIVNFRQLIYLRTADLGLNKDQIVSVHTPDGDTNRLALRETFKASLRSLSGVENVTYSAGTPAGFHAITPTLEISGSRSSIKAFYVDQDFLNVMGISLVQGRNLAKSDRITGQWTPQDQMAGILLNETSIREFGLDNPIGQVIYTADSNRYQTVVVGVVKDFHFRSLHERIEPLAMVMHVEPMVTLSIRLSSANIPSTLEAIEKEWRKVWGNAPFNFQFLDETFNGHYQRDEQLAKVIGYFTILAIVIACLGLFALSSFMVSRRVKEIGVRKVLGASVGTIYSMLSWDFLKWVLLAIVIASPVAWFLMKMWLSTFAYHIDLGIDVFVIAALIAIGIALLTVTGQSLKVARANPVDSLKYE